jgi:phage terminase small subunit
VPKKGGRLTPQELRFAQTYGESGSPAFAAHEAGYAHLRQSASKNLAKPAVMEEARRIALDVIANQIMPAATKAHMELLTDATVPAGVRAKAVDIAYKYGLADRQEASDKAPSEMTAAEIQARLAGLEATRQRLVQEASERANPVLELEAAPSVLD